MKSVCTVFEAVNSTLPSARPHASLPAALSSFALNEYEGHRVMKAFPC